MDKWLEKDLKYNWHPYTQMKDCGNFPPIMIEKAKGIKLYDNKDNFYYDTISSWWCNVHGHNHPKITAAITKQLKMLDHVLFAGFTHKNAITLAERLVSIAPKDLTRVFFSDNGSTAAETALKISFQYWHNTGRTGKTKFLSLDAGYHGDTVGAMSVGGLNLFNKIFSPLFFRTYKAPSPYCYRCPMGKKRANCALECVKPMENILKEHSNEISAVILEPLVMAAGGMIIYPKEYLAKAAKLAKKYDVHLILDEVATGFGRTGRMFACEHAGVTPDFMCLSKGITSGTLPLGVTMTTEKIYKAFYADHKEKKTFYHGHTYTANPIVCAAALASLDIFEEEKTLNKVKKMSKLLRAGLERFRDLAIVGDVRSIGMIGAIELVKDKKAKEPFSFEERVGFKIYKEGLKKNLILRPLGNIVYLFLPLSVGKKELQYILSNTYQIIASVKK
ncbi:MAG: adenosylmethionine--8-amino-7-oxononanoate transaminase [Candidatus Omnitrophica bacterium]|nr:adenosylmethionine--8-amino-7-oxononanoate transaminase [Candidatus Omnitrophota bacterium]